MSTILVYQYCDRQVQEIQSEKQFQVPASGENVAQKWGGGASRTSSTCARCGRVYLLRTFLNEHISLHLGYEHDFVMYTLYTT